MIDKDKKKFKGIMDLLGEVFATGSVKQSKADAYFLALEDLPLEDIQQAVKVLIKLREDSYIPKPAEIRDEVRYADQCYHWRGTTIKRMKGKTLEEGE